MANYSDDDDDYDVLIYDPPSDNETFGQDGAEPCPPYDPAVLSARLLPRLYTAASLLGLLDNLLMVTILLRCHGLRQVEHIYLLNAAAANLCFLLALPLQAHAASPGAAPGRPTCTALVTLTSVGLHAQALFAALLALKSYLLCFPVRRLSWAAGRRACGLLASGLAWLAAALLALPEVLLCVFVVVPGDSQASGCPCGQPHFLPGQGTAWAPFLTMKVNVAGLLVPLLVFGVCLGRQGKTPRRSDLFRLVSALVAVFLLMWGPRHVALFLSAFGDSFSLRDCRSRYHLARSVQVTGIIAGAYCCVNPLLFLLLDKAWRRRLCPDCCPRPPAEGPAPAAPWEECDCSTHL